MKISNSKITHKDLTKMKILEMVSFLQFTRQTNRKTNSLKIKIMYIQHGTKTEMRKWRILILITRRKIWTISRFNTSGLINGYKRCRGKTQTPISRLDQIDGE